MSDVVNEMKKNLNTWWKDKGPKVEDMLKTTAKKTEELTQKAKLKYDIFQAERSLEKKFADMGEYVFNKINDDSVYDYKDNEDISQFLSDVKKLEDKIKSLREDYLKVGKAEDLSHAKSDEEESKETSEESDA